MGMIKIEIKGSFGNREKTFSAMENGHAHCAAEAIRYLTKVLQDGINSDHTLHEDKCKPEKGYTKESWEDGHH